MPPTGRHLGRLASGVSGGQSTAGPASAGPAATPVRKRVRQPVHASRSAHRREASLEGASVASPWAPNGELNRIRDRCPPSADKRDAPPTPGFQWVSVMTWAGSVGVTAAPGNPWPRVVDDR